MDDKKITIYSYMKVWNVEKKIYNIGNFVLPVPVELWSAVYCLFAFLGICVLQKAFPIITVVPAIIRLGFVPYGIMYILRKKKLDGKNPVRYFIGLTGYLCDRKSYTERFAKHMSGKERIMLDWNCSVGCRPPVKSGKGKKNV